MQTQFLAGTLKGSFITLLTLLIQVTGNTQTIKSEWVKVIEDYIYPLSVVNDSMGNTFFIGLFQDTVDADPGSGTFNLISEAIWPIASSTLILKLDTLGEFVWAASIDGAASSASIDDNADISIVGLYSGIVDLDPDTSSLIVTSPILFGVQRYDVFVVKLSNDGDLVWGTSLGASAGVGGHIGVGDHTLDTMGNVYITGSFSGVIDFDTDTSVFSMTANGHTSIFAFKLNNTGDFLWAKSCGGSSWDHGIAIEVDIAGNVLVMGYFETSVDFDPGVGVFSKVAIGGSDIFLLKLDNNGDFITAKAIGGFFDDRARAMCIDVDGNIYITGTYAHLVDFDPDTSVHYMHSSHGQDQDMFVLKLNGNGGFVWSKSMEVGGNFTGGFDIASDGQDGIYLMGKYQEITDFDPGLDTFLLGPSYPSLYKTFYQKLDTNGGFVFAGTTTGSASYVHGSALSVIPSGEITLLGYFNGGPEDFDPGTSVANLSSTGVADIYIQRLLQCEPSYGTHTTSGCNSYQWIDGITYTSSDSSAIFNIECGAYNGCDSIVNLDLTIYPFDLSVTTSNDTLIANETGAIYQWLDCNNNYSEINGETAKSFNTTTNGSYAVLVTKGDCKDTSLCQHVVVTELDEALTSNIFRIYPNPNLGEFTIEFTKKMVDSYEVSIQNSFGQIIKSYRPLKKVLNIDLTSFDKGIYFVKVDTEKGAIWSKIIMQ